MFARFRFFITMLAMVLCIVGVTASAATDAASERARALLNRMTTAEKIAQLQCLSKAADLEQQVGADGIGGLACTVRSLGARAAAEKMNEHQRYFIERTRLGIPVILHEEALHGLVARGATAFPQAIGLAATWNTELMSRVAEAIARESRSRGIRQVLSPVVNIARDARWGRVEETYGEDPYLSSQMGVAFCRPFEAIGVVTTPKHFAANVGDGGRDSNPVHHNERLLREIYFPAFRACVQQAGAQSIMAAYNSLDGIPCSSNHWLLTKILREEWGFRGFVVSDYGALDGVHKRHLTAADEVETAAQTLNAGLEVEFPTRIYYGEPLKKAVQEGLVSEATLDEAVLRVLEVKFRIGLFEEPYADPLEAERINDSPEHRNLALQAARESIVLLKNEGQLLPLSRTIKHLAVIGPDADTVRLGGYSGFGMKTVSILDGLREKLGVERIIYEKGFDLKEKSYLTIPATYLSTEDGRKGLRGEYFANKELGGKPALERIDEQILFKWGKGQPHPLLPKDRFSVRWTGYLRGPKTGLVRLALTTDDGVRMWIDDRLLLDSWHDRGATTDWVAVRTVENRKYRVRIEYYENGSDTYAEFGWDYGQKESVVQQPVLQMVKKCDAAVIVAGILEGEAHDRARLDLPETQERMIQAVSATGKPVIVLLVGGGAITMMNWEHNVHAILMCWYGGEKGGQAVADVLFGDYNPGGRLPITFPLSISQTPLYYNYKPSGRSYNYLQLSGYPMFYFGHGLSYSDFHYSDLQIAPDRDALGAEIKISFNVKNTGTMAGDEVVQLYTHDLVASVARPLKELKRFKRIHLQPGENRLIEFNLSPDDLSFLDADLHWIQEPGAVEVMIGSSSKDIRLQSQLIL
ncbi:glycoside hydrolase family 3 C-terminal domain-containing protein [candidate division KSB1 bacterium]|nr:glycoside hydrolase family 3 C-terminal domain-containing protein [candidate division KSB1 bacterium]